MVVADIRVPKEHQDIFSHHADLTVLLSSHESQLVIRSIQPVSRIFYAIRILFYLLWFGTNQLHPYPELDQMYDCFEVTVKNMGTISRESYKNDHINTRKKIKT